MLVSTDLSPIDAAIAPLESIGLEELGTAALMNRVERKFMLPRDLLPSFLQRCAAEYRVLELHGRRRAQYRTVYFDTSDLSFYHAHLTGRVPRR